MLSLKPRLGNEAAYDKLRLYIEDLAKGTRRADALKKIGITQPEAGSAGGVGLREKQLRDKEAEFAKKEKSTADRAARFAEREAVLAKREKLAADQAAELARRAADLEQAEEDYQERIAELDAREDTTTENPVVNVKKEPTQEEVDLANKRAQEIREDDERREAQLAQARKDREERLAREKAEREAKEKAAKEAKEKEEAEEKARRKANRRLRGESAYDQAYAVFEVALIEGEYGAKDFITKVVDMPTRNDLARLQAIIDVLSDYVDADVNDEGAALLKELKAYHTAVSMGVEDGSGKKCESVAPYHFAMIPAKSEDDPDIISPFDFAKSQAILLIALRVALKQQKIVVVHRDYILQLNEKNADRGILFNYFLYEMLPKEFEAKQAAAAAVIKTNKEKEEAAAAAAAPVKKVPLPAAADNEALKATATRHARMEAAVGELKFKLLFWANSGALKDTITKDEVLECVESMQTFNFAFMNDAEARKEMNELYPAGVNVVNGVGWALGDTTAAKESFVSSEGSITRSPKSKASDEILQAGYSVGAEVDGLFDGAVVRRWVALHYAFMQLAWNKIQRTKGVGIDRAPLVKLDQVIQIYGDYALNTDNSATVQQKAAYQYVLRVFDIDIVSSFKTTLSNIDHASSEYKIDDETYNVGAIYTDLIEPVAEVLRDTDAGQLLHLAPLLENMGIYNGNPERLEALNRTLTTGGFEVQTKYYNAMGVVATAIENGQLGDQTTRELLEKAWPMEMTGKGIKNV